jgi:hypothetical protein
MRRLLIKQVYSVWSCTKFVRDETSIWIGRDESGSIWRVWNRRLAWVTIVLIRRLQGRLLLQQIARVVPNIPKRMRQISMIFGRVNSTAEPNIPVVIPNKIFQNIFFLIYRNQCIFMNIKNAPISSANSLRCFVTVTWNSPTPKKTWTMTNSVVLLALEINN